MIAKVKPYTKDYIIGDVHAEFAKLNQFINKKKPRNIYACGDFGWWPGEKGYEIDLLKNGETKIYWCDGNHENHSDLERLRKQYPFSMSLNTPIEVSPNVFYCPRGTVKYLDDGRKMLFVGGAHSIDKQWRTPGYDWFLDETLNWRDMYQFDNIGKVDIVISHTCPDSFIPSMISKTPVGYWDKSTKDPSTGYLEWILENHKPELFFFGHWHIHFKGYKKGCHYTALNMLNHTGWFVELT